jgi:S1-C subfamily serine protease
LVAGAQSGIVRIEASGCGGKAIGTGFLVGPQLVATVDHVVAGSTTITLKQGRRSLAGGTVVGEDPTRDVALVRSSVPLHGKVLRLAARAPKLGETVAALGFPLGLPLSVTQGSVSGLGRTVPIDGTRRRQMVQTDAAVNPGNSGGPLLSLDSGDVVGLVDLGTNEANGIGFAVSAQVAEPLLTAWRAAPQPVPVSTCTEPSTAPEAGASAPDTSAPPSDSSPASAVSTYSGNAFSVAYPSGWQVQSAEKTESYGTDTTIVSPADNNIALRVDVSPNAPTSDPQSAAAPVISAVERDPGYEQLDLSADTFDGFPALHWEFLVREGGVLVHKEDEFFVDTDDGDGVAVLTQAPADEYSSLAPELTASRDTLSMS